MSRRSPFVGAAGIVIVLALAAAAPVRSVTYTHPGITRTLTASPNPAADEAPVTIILTAMPVLASFTNVRFWLDGPGTGGTCEPADFCFINNRGRPEWIFPAFTSKTTMTWQTEARTRTKYTSWATAEGQAVCVDPVCPPTLTIQAPTLKVSLTRVGTGTIHSGDVIHLKAVGTTNAGPVLGADLHVNLGAGLANPTSISPATARYSGPPANYFDDTLDLAQSEVMEFDAVVIAPDGSDISPSAQLQGGTYSYDTVTTTLKLHIGTPPATVAPTPKKTAQPTARPTVRPTATPTTPPTDEPVTPGPPTAQPTALITVEPPTPSPTPLDVAMASPGATIPTAPTREPMAPASTAAASSGPLGELLLAGLILVMLSGVGYLARRQLRLRRP